MSRAARTTSRPQAARSRTVSRPQDPAETQADRVADVVGRGGSVTGWSFGSVPLAAGVHREEKGKPPGDEDKLKEAAAKVGEAALETRAGKDLQAKVKETPLVRQATQFLDTTPGKIVAGGAIAAGVGGLAAAGQPLPFQAPAIPLDRITPGLSARVTVDGPLNAPTFVGLSLTYREQVPKGKAGPTGKERIAADIARLRAQQEMFKPQAQKDQEKADEQAAIARLLALQAKQLGTSTLLPLTPSGKPKTVDVSGQATPAEPKKDQEDAPVQREPATAASTSEAAQSALDTSGVEGAISGRGRALDPSTRRSMEARFGYDFSTVQVHDDASAAKAAGGLEATAFTVGDDIVFGAGGYDPSTAGGRHLLAHELAHVVQQAGASPSVPPRERFAAPGRPLDRRDRDHFERALGVDLGRVRIHADAEAAADARTRRASAYTLGSDIVFGEGAYRPETLRGRWMLAHELAHVAQGLTDGGVEGVAAIEADASHAATSALQGAGAGTTAGTGAGVRARRAPGSVHLFGEPDHVPDLTFVSTAGGAGFLQQATAYHQTWGLAPARFGSMQGLLHALAQGNGTISRLRIVSHANFDNIFSPLFDGGAAGITEGDLEAYAESDARGLRQTLGTLFGGLAPRVLTQLRTSNSAALQPFGLDNPTRVPPEAVTRLVNASVDLLGVRIATGGLGQGQRATLEAALTTELAALRAEVQQPAPAGARVTAAQALDLQNAITGVTGFNLQMGAQPQGRIDAVRAATSGVGQGFRNDLQAVRARLSAASWVDLRGCRVGQRPAYLAAVARFFGTGAARPHVSGPDLWQSYPRLGYQTVRDTDLRRSMANRDVADALAHWAVVTGVRQRLSWWLQFLGRVLADEAAQQAIQTAPSPPSLLGGLRLRLDPFLTFDVLGAGVGAQGGPPPLQAPTFARPHSATPGFGVARLRNPLVETARREIPLYTAPEGELRYYLGAGLPLLVQRARNVEEISLLIRAGHEREAIDSWLGSEWEPAAPGLPALQRGDWRRDELRQVEAVSNLNARRRATELYVSPDPRYDRHIQRT